MKRIKLFGAYFFTLFFYLLLSACGGEGGEDILDLPGISSYQLEMVLVAQNNDTEVEEVSNIFPRRIRGELLDDQGQPVANQTVSVEVESARIEQSLATTNEQGIFYLSVYAGYDGEKTASAIGVYTDPNGDLATTKTHFTSQGDEPRIEFVGGDQIIIGMFDVNGNSIGTTDTPISSSNPATLIAQIGGSAIARQLVTFSSDLGVLDPSNGRALTDSQGIATIQLYAGESGGAGTASVTYTPPGDSGPVSAGINFSSLGGGVVDNLVASLSLQVISQTSGLDTTLVTGTNAGLLVATLTDSDGNALPQRVVEFSTGLGTIIPATGTALTDQNGEARVQIVAGEDEGATTIEARSGSMSASISIAIQDPLETGNSEEIIVSPTLLVEQQSGGGTTLVASNQIILGTSGTIRIQVTDLTGAPLSNRLVSLQSTLGEIYPVNGVVLTDEQGFAEALLFTEGDDLGAGELSASVTDSNGSTVTERLAFAVNDIELSIGATIGGVFQPGQLDLGVAASLPLAPGASTTITVELRDSDGNLITTTEEVSFSSTCVGLGTAFLDASVNAFNGVATAVYRAEGCVGVDLITAIVNSGSGSETATGSITVNSSPATSIQFVSATPTDIALEGAGGVGRDDFSEVVFTVKDNLGNPVSNQTVDFELTSTVGGITLSSASENSDASGNVQVTIFSGTVPTSVRVLASFTESGELISTLSDQLSISTGIPTQEGFDLSAETLNPNAYRINGIENRIVIRAADRFKNPVPDGTTVSFTAEGGAIEPSCTTVAGNCSVTWTSQGERGPAKDGTDRNGRITVLAYAVGEESFLDENGNGVLDLSEVNFVDNTSEPFVDKDEDGSRTVITGSNPFIEEFKDYNQNGSFETADAVFQGVVCSDEARAVGHCQDLNYVFADLTFVASSDQLSISAFDGSAPFAEITGNKLVSAAAGSSEEIYIEIADENGNAPPVDTRITVTTDGVKNISATSSFTVPDALVEPYGFNLTIGPEDDSLAGQFGTVTIQTEINGHIVNKVITIEYN